MEPETHGAHPSQEAGNFPRRGESSPSFLSPESPAQSQPEKAPKQESKEAASGQGAGDPTFAAPALPAPTVPVAEAPADPDPVDLPADDNPLIAGDDDLIEREWVDRAKKIIATTKDDPYLQEKEVSKLQADYLKKRYGKDIKLPVD